MKRALVAVLGLVLVVAVASMWQRRGIDSPQTPASERPNVVLITIDTLRADRLGRGFTTHIERLKARGTSYTNVRTTAPLTLPAHVSIMTGQPPYVHGARENGMVFEGKQPTIARRFRDAGYRTGAFVGAYVLNRRFGLADGFETYDDDVPRDVNRADRLEAERPASQVIDAALKWLPTASTPYFMWVHVYDPHAPYEPPAAYVAHPTASAYDREVAYADAQIGRLLDAIDAAGTNTVVAVAGDHGESLGEHGEQTHGMLAYDSTLRVPLIVAGVGVQGGSDNAARSVTELAPMLLEAAGLQPLGPRHTDVYAESRYPRRAGWHALGVLADLQWKLIASSEFELYDLRVDPAEQQNVAAQHPNVVEGMAAALARMTAAAAADAPVSLEASERLRALGYVSGSSPIVSDDRKAPNPAKMIATWTAFEGALAHLQANRAASALPLLRGLATEHPRAPVFQTTYAQALQEAGRPAEAVAVYKAAVAQWPVDAALFHDLAVAARLAGDAAEAYRAEQAALALDSSNPSVFNGVGLLHADAGRPADAAAAFEKATTLDPSNAGYWTNLGNARRGLNDAGTAEAAYRKALAIDPSFPDALNGLGTLLVQSRRASEAVPLFQRALERDPELHEARLNLGIAYQEVGEKEKAAAAYRDLLAKAPASMARERQAAAQLLRQLR